MTTIIGYQRGDEYWIYADTCGTKINAYTSPVPVDKTYTLKRKEPIYIWLAGSLDAVNYTKLFFDKLKELKTKTKDLQAKTNEIIDYIYRSRKINIENRKTQFWEDHSNTLEDMWMLLATSVWVYTMDTSGWDYQQDFSVVGTWSTYANTAYCTLTKVAKYKWDLMEWVLQVAKDMDIYSWGWTVHLSNKN